MVASVDDVQMALTDKSAQVVDARPANRFRGEAPEPREGMRPGHMPGAKNVPVTELIEDGRLIAPEKIKEKFAAGGVDLDKPVITSCGSGVTAATLVVRARRHRQGAEGALRRLLDRMGRTAGSAGRDERLADGAAGDRSAAKPNRPVALVTGAANGIGRAISHHLLDAGWCVMAFDLPKTRLIQQFRGWARSSATIEGDVADEDTVRDAVRFALDRFGRLDAVVANAGILIRRPIRRLSLEDWRRVIDTNLTATFLLARAAQRPLALSEGLDRHHRLDAGADVGAQHRILLGLQGRPARTDARARHQPRPRHPGQLRQPRLDRDQRLRQAQAQGPRPASRRTRRQAQDIAEIVAFLLDREKSGFVTGANFVVDGGMTRKMIYVE